MARTELPNGVILPAEYSDDWYEDMTSNLTKLDDVIGSDSEKLNSNDVAFLRMSSAALTDGGTGNFSDLNSSNKLKTGDYVLDSGRKLYQVVSVDSTNETFTVGNSLFKITAESDLAPVAESGDYDDLDNKPDLNPYDQHIVNTDIHVTTADKSKWDNGVTQSYVFRYSSTALVASSTNSNALLDNTDNLKVSDKVIDSDGVLFSIIAIDTANSTFTIGTALIDLALDANVVHTSGNETINGVKTFTDPQNLTGYTAIRIYSPNDEVGVLPSAAQAREIRFTDKNNVPISYFAFQHRASSAEPFRTCWRQQKVDGTSSYYSVNFNNLGEFYPEINNPIKLGTSTNRWADCQTYLVNGLTPSSLGMPEFSKRVDIAGYISNLTGATNNYTPSVNGWLYVGSNDASYLALFDTGSGGCGIRFSDGVVGDKYACIPCQAGRTLGVRITCTNLAHAYFIPCQGNV